jgi:hypothetical protein
VGRAAGGGGLGGAERPLDGSARGGQRCRLAGCNPPGQSFVQGMRGATDALRLGLAPSLMLATPPHPSRSPSCNPPHPLAARANQSSPTNSRRASQSPAIVHILQLTMGAPATAWTPHHASPPPTPPRPAVLCHSQSSRLNRSTITYRSACTPVRVCGVRRACVASGGGQPAGHHPPTLPLCPPHKPVCVCCCHARLSCRPAQQQRQRLGGQ